MLFTNVSIDAVVHVDAPIRLTSAEIMGRLRPTLDRLGIRPDLLEELAGIRERRVWGGATQVSDAATAAGEAALAASRVAREEIGLLVSTSVSRDYVEPSTASVVHGQLGLADTCQNFDVGNACLAFLNGMDIAGSMIERGDVDYALIVDAEVSDDITEHTIARLNQPGTTADQFREEFASLTLGSGATAMVLGRGDLLPDGHRYLGGVTRAATAYSHLCRGTMQRMVTDTRSLLAAGLDLASKTFDAAKNTLDWRPGELDEFVVHQVSKVHTSGLIDRLGIDPDRVLTIFGEHGNMGPASIPVTLSKLNELGRLRNGTRVALMGIGSGLNCTMAEVVW